jgi:hypothetical protein
MNIFVDSVGLLGPGLTGWAASRAVLTGAAAYEPSGVSLPPSNLLPAAERRRTGLNVRLALAVGHEALAAVDADPTELASVFTSSGGDGEVLHQICETLAGREREVSPTQFHNSVHNAAGGYWSIAMRATAASTSLCCYDWSFAAGLIEAATLAVSGNGAVLLVAYDVPYPEPISGARAIGGVFGVALLLSPTRSPRSFSQLDIAFESVPAPATSMQHLALETLRASIPAARALPILTALAARQQASVVLDYVARPTLRVEVRPC